MNAVVITYVDSRMHHISEKMSRTEAIIKAQDMHSQGYHVEAVDWLGQENEELLWSAMRVTT